jgi:hypothetical protein
VIHFKLCKPKKTAALVFMKNGADFLFRFLQKSYVRPHYCEFFCD